MVIKKVSWLNPGTQKLTARQNPEMATSVKIVSVSMTQYENSMLAPAPSCSDWDYMMNIIDADTTPAFENISDAVGKTLKILTSYRGWTVYLAGGLSYIRVNPTTSGGNGYVSFPEYGKEMGRMHWNESVYEIEVEYQPKNIHVYYHLPGAQKVTFAASYDNFEDARCHAATKIALEQYVAIINDSSCPVHHAENDDYICRYLMTPGCGPLSCIPLEGGGFNKKLSNIVNFVMASEELPCIPGEDE